MAIVNKTKEEEGDKETGRQGDMEEALVVDGCLLR